jgi:hypothetical protein
LLASCLTLLRSDPARTPPRRPHDLPRSLLPMPRPGHGRATAGPLPGHCRATAGPRRDALGVPARSSASHLRASDRSGMSDNPLAAIAPATGLFLPAAPILLHWPSNQPRAPKGKRQAPIIRRDAPRRRLRRGRFGASHAGAISIPRRWRPAHRCLDHGARSHCDRVRLSPGSRWTSARSRSERASSQVWQVFHSTYCFAPAGGISRFSR